MAMHKFQTAYRHRDGTVEGFRGVGDTKANAQHDAWDQISKKLKIVAEWYESDDFMFNNDQLIRSFHGGLTPSEVFTIQDDWRSGVRY